MVEHAWPPPEGLEDRHDILRRLFENLRRGKSDAALLGEVDKSPEKLREYLDAEQMNMSLGFLLQNYTMLALATEQADALEKGLRLLPSLPEDVQWVNFLRNVDECDLERLEPDELDAVFAAFAPAPEMRIYGRGIRRRLAPLMEGDERRLKLAFSLLFALPGAPLFVYGDEIGMGDDLSQQGRSAVRPPMQWSGAENAGFSDASPADLIQPVITTGNYSHRHWNVEEQRARPDSLFAFVKCLIDLRRNLGVFSGTAHEVLKTGTASVFAQRYGTSDDGLILLHNLGAGQAEVELPLDPAAAIEIEPILGEPPSKVETGLLRVMLEPYGLRWWRVGPPRP